VLFTYIRLYEKVIERMDYTFKKEKIIQRYKDIINELNMSDTLLKTIDESLENYIATLRKKPSRLLDALLSCGEDFNAQIIAEYNNSQGIPTRYISPGEAGITVTDLPQNAQILNQSYEDCINYGHLKKS